MLKSVSNHLIYDCICLYVIGVWIVGVVCEVGSICENKCFLGKIEDDLRFMMKW